MGQLLSRVQLLIRTLAGLGAEYHAVKQRVDSSPGLPVNDPTLSFWSVPPAEFPTPTNTSLPTHVDVILIGSGITGVSCTHTLLKKGPPGLRVLVLEARDICSGATGRNGGHINPPLFHDYVQLKSEFGIESAKRIIRFRCAHRSAIREVVEDIGALDYSQMRDIERLDVHFERDAFDEQVEALEVWRKDMPEDAAGSRVVEGGEAAKVTIYLFPLLEFLNRSDAKGPEQMFQLTERVVGVITTPGCAANSYRIVTSIFVDLLRRYPDQLDLFTHTPCTGITPPSTIRPYYTVQTPRGTLTARHIIHATNGWASHLLPGLRGKIIPLRGLMTAQRPGTRLPTAAAGSQRAHIFYYPAPGYDYLTQLPKDEGKGGGGEMLFGGGAAQAGRIVLSEVGVADDSGYHLGIASHVQGALPEYFGRRNWGAEGVDDPREAGENEGTWDQGRIKALWTGILGISADMQPWVGRVPSVISCRAAPPPSLTKVSDKDAASDGTVVGRSLAPSGEWVSAGYSGEGMVHAWLCAHALALMVLGLEKEEGVHTWFPTEFRLTEKRWKRATIERLMDEF